MPHCVFCGKVTTTHEGLKRHVAGRPECRRQWASMIEDVEAENLDDAPDVDFPHQDAAPAGHVHPRPSPDTDNNPALRKTRRTTVEEVEDEDGMLFPNNGRYFEPQSDAGWALREGETNFERYRTYQEEEGEDPWSPFEDAEEWDLAQWLVKNLGQTRTNEFLKLPITQNRTKLLFHNNCSFLQCVDELPHGPGWSCKKVTVRGNCEDENGEMLQEEVELWCRNPVECVKELIGNPAFKEDMAYSPAKAYADRAGQDRVIDEMWTADWWGDKQKALPEGATIAPIILSSDKMSLSQFRGDKSAWPVYMSIGNIAKAKRCQASARATVLIGYLPAGKLDCFTPDACSLAGYRLFHHCMALLLEPLIGAGNDGVEMVCADSWVHCVYPILAAYVADFPEQCLCLVAANERGDALNSAMHDPESTKDILHRRKIGQHPPEFEANGLPFTPDLLHQLHKGVFKDHLVKWCIDIIGEDEMDSRFKAIPNYPGLRHFKKGISSVKQWTGREHKEMQRVFVGLLSRAVPSRVLVVARSILDFSYFAQLQVQTTESLEALQTALTVFHTNKDILKELTVREHFNIPKLHQLSHYVQSITLFGAADGFNTELPERLHIDFAKDSYRASNKQDYEEQMALWLQCQEAVFLHSAYLDWLSQQPRSKSPAGLTGCHSNPYNFDADSDTDSESETPNLPATEPLQATHVLAKAPAHPHQSVGTIITAHGATEFLPALRSFLLKNLPCNTIVPGLQDRFDLYRQVVIVTPPDLRVSDMPQRRQIRATPEMLLSGRKPGIPARFDMALIADRPRSSNFHTLEGIFFPGFSAVNFDNRLVAGVRVAQVRAIFTLPRQFGAYSRALAYVEWFTPFKPPDPVSRMRQVSRSTRQLHRNAAVIHVDEIVRPCHLIPKMGPTVDLRLRSGNAYEVANDFYFNEFIDGEMFCTCVISN
ncbi:uncharacterized protein EDB91DRAFT_1238678 [Suillus paluster]|uniref:uncharacterized protein n=1 Tax=Suillus paluster TaxID=48578 RepID=UPI001B8605F1|nr:uncharacterized protein EDB91DRAFT_1238678 [Suillus paluster]KAG1732870.1 hypothetical protein EDB91DRAFT_1238678 [Suillus paluster]